MVSAGASAARAIGRYRYLIKLQYLSLIMPETKGVRLEKIQKQLGIK